MTSVIIDKKYHDEIELLKKDQILIDMVNEFPKGIDGLELHTHGFMRQVNNEYVKRGGQHQPLTIGSLGRAFREILVEKKRGF